VPGIITQPSRWYPARLHPIRIFGFVLGAIAAPIAFAQSISTYAGGGSRDGLKATEIVLTAPYGLAADGKGNLYISEESGSSVQRVNLVTGVMERFAGNGGGSYSGDNGPAREASLKRPHGLTLDDAGNLFIADEDNGRIRRVDIKTGVITTFAGGGDPNISDAGDAGLATAAFLGSPVGVAWHDGELYIAETNYDANVVRKVDRNGIISTVAGKRGLVSFSGDGGPATEAGFNSPLAVAVDGSGNIYIADNANRRLRRVDHVTHKIDTVAGGGTEPDNLGDRPGLEANLCPAALSIDATGLIYVADPCHRRVLRFNPATNRIALFMGNGDYGGGDGNVATAAGIEQPYAIALDPAGNLFAEDTSNGSIRRVDAATRIVSTVAGGGTFIGDGRVANAALLAGPHGLAFDKNGNLLIADSEHSLVRRVDKSTGVISTFAGLVNNCCSGPDAPGPATEVPIGFPIDIAVTASGIVYFSDGLGSIWAVDDTGRFSGMPEATIPTERMKTMTGPPSTPASLRSASSSTLRTIFISPRGAETACAKSTRSRKSLRRSPVRAPRAPALTARRRSRPCSTGRPTWPSIARATSSSRRRTRALSAASIQPPETSPPGPAAEILRPATAMEVRPRTQSSRRSSWPSI
jgi:streptogramin lyase